MDVRLLKTEQERAEAGRISLVAFHMKSDNLEESMERWGKSDSEDWGAFTDDGKLMGHVINNHFTAYIDGTPVMNGGVGGVSTLPEYREEGAIRHIFEKMLPYEYERGEVISTLSPFSHVFYRKFGYETVCYLNKFTFRPSCLKGYHFNGWVKLWNPDEPVDEFAKLYSAFAKKHNFAILHEGEQIKCQIHGAYYQNRRFCYLLGDEKGACAYFTFSDHGCVSVENLAYDGRRGMNAILGFLSRFGADYDTIELRVPTDVEMMDILPEPYDFGREILNGHMARVVNVKKLLEIIKKPENCSFTVKITDEIIPQNNGTWKVCGSVVEQTDEEADIVCDIRGFSQLATGGTTLGCAELRNDIEVIKNRETLEKVFVKKPIYMTDNY